MHKMIEQLNKASEIIEEFNSGAFIPLERIREMHKALCQCHYEITKFNVSAFKTHNTEQYNFIGAVSAGRIFADERVPELRQSRKILETLDFNIWALRSEISIMKKD